MTVDRIRIHSNDGGWQHEQVDTAAAVLLVRSGLSVNIVGTGSAPNFIVAVTAKELIFTAAAQQNVVTFEADNVFIAAFTTQQFFAGVAIDVVAAGAAKNLISHFGVFRAGGGGRERVQRVTTCSTEQPLTGLIIAIAGFASQFIIATVTKHDVNPGAAFEHVAAFASADHVVALVAFDDQVQSGSRIEIIHPWTAAEFIRIGTAKNPVVSIATTQLVTPVCGGSV
ncbi:hypothetical protein Pla52n_68720 [Stieleria varia]|uniref:Uncharacterized protein n=1 Tax=Stieleria varia TaxID=2528005 RepID=A0A5C5ZQ68_9BACT|nr:hypothetical protein Pla52n_68720 [Stieleria varia]